MSESNQGQNQQELNILQEVSSGNNGDQNQNFGQNQNTGNNNSNGFNNYNQPSIPINYQPLGNENVLEETVNKDNENEESSQNKIILEYQNNDNQENLNQNQNNNLSAPQSGMNNYVNGSPNVLTDVNMKNQYDKDKQEFKEKISPDFKNDINKQNNNNENQNIQNNNSIIKKFNFNNKIRINEINNKIEFYNEMIDELIDEADVPKEKITKLIEIFHYQKENEKN